MFLILFSFIFSNFLLIYILIFYTLSLFISFLLSFSPLVLFVIEICALVMSIDSKFVLEFIYLFIVYTAEVADEANVNGRGRVQWGRI